MPSVRLSLAQTGSASATLHVEDGDTVTFELSETVHSGEFANVLAAFQTLMADIHNITVVINTTGGAT